MTKLLTQGMHLSVPIEFYHTQCTEGVSLSSSAMRDILPECGGCPAYFWAESSLNPKAEDFDSEAMAFGRAVHALVLGEPEFLKHFVVSPFDDFRAKPAKEWLEGYAWRKDTRQIIKAEKFEKMVAMSETVKRTPQTSNCFEQGKPEVSMIWKDDEFGVMLKSRPDFMPERPSDHFMLEYKSARSVESFAMSKQAFALGYDIQASLVYDGYKALTGEEPLGLAHVNQEKDAPFLAALFMFDGEQLEIGRRRRRKAMRRFAECYELHLAGKPAEIAWPGFTTEPSFYQTPTHILKQMETEDDDVITATRRESVFGDNLRAY